MRIPRPTAQQERWLVLSLRYPALREAIEQTGRGGGWKTTTRLARMLGFLLGLLAAGLLAGAVSLFAAPWLVGGLLLVLAAEWLVARRRVFRSGIEEALYLCGAVAIVAQVLAWTRDVDVGAGAALVSTAALLAGWRLSNPVFTTLAAAGYSLAVAFAQRALFADEPRSLPASLFCAGLVVAAWLAGARTWRRPAHDQMLEGLVIVMPWCACAWLLAHAEAAGSSRQWMSLLAALAFCAASLCIGAKRRVHAPLVGALGCLVFAAWSLHRMLDWPGYWQLIVAGAVLLAASLVAERLLRHRRFGITSDAVTKPGAAELLQVVGAAQLTPDHGGALREDFQGEGGEFAGGGASGRF